MVNRRYASLYQRPWAAHLFVSNQMVYLCSHIAFAYVANALGASTDERMLKLENAMNLLHINT